VQESERIMTALGAVVFGGLFGLAVLWLLLTGPDDDGAPGDEAENGWDHSQRQERSNSASVSAGAAVSSSWAATHSSQK
jgi:hypothetical protein